MGKLIKLHPTPKWVEKGQVILDGLNEEDATAVIALITSAIIQDVKAGLAGTLDEKENTVFKAIDQEYKNKAGQCYFCNKEIDPNETAFNLDTHLCWFCILKVANILVAVGADPRKLFPKIGKREVQKTKL